MCFPYIKGIRQDTIYNIIIVKLRNYSDKLERNKMRRERNKMRMKIHTIYLEHK